MKRSGLKRDAEKIAVWVRRSRVRAAVAAQARPRKGLTRKRRERPVEGPLTPHEWWAEVYRAANGRCAVSKQQASSYFDRRFHRHHIIPKDRLRKRGLHMKVWDSRNGMLTLDRVHVRHTQGVERIPRSALPASVYAFAAECGPWAERYLEDHYA